MLRSFFRRRIRGAQDDAEDLVQETLLAVHTRRATYDRNRAFTVWLYAIARYKLVDHFRRHRHLCCPIEELSEMLVIEGFEDASAAVLDVERLLKGLPTKQAGLIRDTKLAGLSVAEAAERARVGQSDVKVSVHRGLRALAVRIRGET